MLDFPEGLPGDNPGSLRTISQDIGYVLMFGGKVSPSLPEWSEGGVNLLSQHVFVVDTSDFSLAALFGKLLAD